MGYKHSDAGKGSQYRPVDKRKYDEKYDKINWNTKKPKQQKTLKNE